MKLSFRSVWSEFKAFAFKGNMIDLAVAVVIGAAFSGVINSLVKDIIMPSISYVTSAATAVKHTAAKVTREVTSRDGATPAPPATESAVAPAPAPPAAPAAAPTPAGDAQLQAVDFSWHIGRIQIGHFIAELINFMLIAFSVFILMVKILGSAARRVGHQSEPAEPLTKECPECLSIIPYKARRCSHCTSVLTTNQGEEAKK
jgi:large conductance mechanosensitive channel